MAETASEPSWLTGLDFAITDAPAAGGGAASGGAPAVGDVPNSGGPGAGRFSLSREEAQSMLTTAKNVLDQLKSIEPTAEALVHIQPPADDPGSNSYNTLLIGAGGGQGAFSAGKAQVDLEFTYIKELVSKLEKALGIIGATDEESAADVKAAAAGSQDKGFA
ncbi:hypothetical protein VSH64_38605 [Amycolatopsis rhabdoformis]|uniref:Uncharacterized protein n=1 Tax=Amycolatopsis rhabdoformis TaxID=1448059 RepID=A0ABZ1I2T6_9PSEU|nr:hypothetical protein [Amycolatopsis rhabdoformis]WSE28692.1 hypothetical protein VSH64_38605 [Amycolatopsis rhabdoformis]